MLLSYISAAAIAQRSTSAASPVQISRATQIHIMRAEDERRWDDSLKKLLADSDPRVRKRAALAAGRIGNESAVPVLAEMLLTDRDNDVRQMAAFALGEIESAGGGYALVEALKKHDQEDANVRARAVEALGKIVAAMLSALPATDAATKASDDERLDRLQAAIVDTLRFENGRRSRPDELTILLGLTAVLRAKPDGVGKLVTEFLHYSDARVIADALNTLARLRLKDGNDKARDLLKHNDPIVRANAARVLGATEDKSAFDVLLDRARQDSDLRVRVGAIRALGQLKEQKAAEPLLMQGSALLKAAKAKRIRRQGDLPAQVNELLEIATTVGNLLKGSKSNSAMQFLRDVRALEDAKAPEVEIAMARIDPELYITEEMKFGVGSPSSIARGLQEVASIKKDQPTLEKSSEFVTAWMRDLIECHTKGSQDDSNRPVCVNAIDVSPLLEAYSAFKPKDVSDVARRQLSESDVIVRSTAAELLGQESSEANTRALIAALPRAMRDADNDAALAILSSLAKQKNKEANDAIKSALGSSDHLVRRRAASLLKANGVGDFSDRIGTVQTRNTDADYRRALARTGKQPTATVVTTKGSFTIAFLPDDAPLNVDNFIQLAKKGYFDGQTVPRVVPNFVVQAGDPRGDQNGGPGYTIRCEINEMPYERAAVGMALSGKDTGGSQWFVTHSPQPHLDGGYTVFGRVVMGMDVVDKIVRGDVIESVVIRQGAGRARMR